MSEFSSTGPASDSLGVRGDTGAIALKSGNAAAVPLGWAIVSHLFETDDQALTIVVGDQGAYSSTGTYLYTHSDTSHTVGAYTRLGVGSISSGTYTRSGSTYTYTQLGSATNALWIPGYFWGSRVTSQNVGHVWSVLVDDVEALSFTDSSLTFSAARRTAAISMERKSSAGFTSGGITYPAADYESLRVAGITLHDIVTPTYQGSGAKLTNTNPAASNAGTIGNNIIYGGFFNTTAQNTADITVDLPNVKLTVSIAGWYKVILRHASSIADNDGVGRMFHHILYKNGAIYELGCERLGAQNGSLLLWANGLQSTWVVYLNAGDYVQPGIGVDGGPITGMFQGESTGTENYFTIALLTRNLL